MHRLFVDAQLRDIARQSLVLEIEAGGDGGEDKLVDLFGNDGELPQGLELSRDRAALQHRGKGFDDLVDTVGVEGLEGGGEHGRGLLRRLVSGREARR